MDINSLSNHVELSETLLIVPKGIYPRVRRYKSIHYCIRFISLTLQRREQFHKLCTLFS